jgi:hypothetical protein
VSGLCTVNDIYCRCILRCKRYCGCGFLYWECYMRPQVEGCGDDAGASECPECAAGVEPAGVCTWPRLLCSCSFTRAAEVLWFSLHRLSATTRASGDYSIGAYNTGAAKSTLGRRFAEGLNIEVPGDSNL